MSPTNALSAELGSPETATSSDRSSAAVQRACARIAPTWPLDRFIAVNPFWGMIDSPLTDVAARLRALSGAQLLMPRSWYRQEYREGRLRDEHLQAALEATVAGPSLAELRILLEQDEPTLSMRARFVDVADAGRDLAHEMSWRDCITHNVSQFCAAFFDEGQAQIGPNRDGGLYASWRRYAIKNKTPALLMGVSPDHLRFSELPATADELIARGLVALGVPVQEYDNYFWSLLLEQNGWASWCAYRRWTARLAGSDDTTISDLLAIRLAWEWMLHRDGGEALAQRWTAAISRWPTIDAAATTASANDWYFQTAIEIAWRQSVLLCLPSGFAVSRAESVAVQAVFCIDVRSEIFRRALETASPHVQTLGFAGFFGIATDYQALGTTATRPQLPGLLSPRLRSSDTGLSANDAQRRTQHLDDATSWKSFKTDALSTFTFIEALGINYAGQLFKDSMGLGASSRIDSAGLSSAMEAKRMPRLLGSVAGETLATEARCELAAGMLRGMSLTQGFARLVMLAGHGSSTRNNPHAAGLDCGACCGQTGEVNARVAAALLNELDVRQGLARLGIHIPESTRFVAALHNTTTDEVEVFERHEVPASHRDDLAQLQSWLEEAGRRTREERARLLGLQDKKHSELHRAVRARTTDWAQVRAEWGLANNAAFVVAPREHCKHVSFEGRSFLHEYRHEEDEGY
ncbi:MAG: DUF2309 domain-containing protein, partial [Clostridia bacterium]|nr:DUF2309 domain-containing protein [Deltaproteobacteria bacterium]